MRCRNDSANSAGLPVGLPAGLAVGMAVVLALGACGSAASAGDIDPRGVFYHEFGGAGNGREWIHIWNLPGDRRYRFSDNRGIAPYDGEILGDGTITWDTLATQSGSGMFTSQNTASQTLFYLGGEYTSELRRAPGTDASFITQIQSRQDGDASISGLWDVRLETLDAASGDVLGVDQLGATTSVTDDLLRIELDDGSFYQGVFETGTTAGFRVVRASVTAPEYASFVGSEMSWNQNLLGDFRMTGADSFESTMLLSTLRQPVFQQQTVYRLVGSRVPAPGGVALAGFAAAFIARRRR